MASGPITSWQIDGKSMEQWHTLFWGAPKSLQMLIAAMKLKTVAPWKKSYDKPRQHNKSRDITLPTKFCLVKTMDFSSIHVWMWEVNYKELAEHWRMDAFELWCWKRLLRVPWTARRSNQSLLKEIIPEYSLERQMLKLKLQNFGHLLRRID